MVALSTIIKPKFPINPKVSKKDGKGKMKNVNHGPSQRRVVPGDYILRAERVNGRAAMLGFPAAVITELVTHQQLSDQLMSNIPLAVIASGLVTVGTASNPRDEGLIWGNFNPEVELVNGRMAMIGMLALLVSETTHPLF